MVNKNKNKREIKELKRKFSPKPTSFYTGGGELFSKEGKSYRGFYRIEDQKIFSGKIKYKNSIELYEVQDEDNVPNDYEDEENNVITLDPKIIREVKGEEDTYSVDINKKTYNKEQLTQVINTEFEEFLNINNFTISQLFNIYNELYYNIPVEGNNSHTTLVERSNDMLENDIFESERNGLLDIISNLEDRINFLENEIPEHPIFKNGSFLRYDEFWDRPEGGIVFYMDKGIRRKVANFELMETIVRAQDPQARRLSKSEYSHNLYIQDVPPLVMDQIELGPIFNYNDLSGKNIN